MADEKADLEKGDEKPVQPSPAKSATAEGNKNTFCCFRV